jgi:hypothetical protein
VIAERLRSQLLSGPPAGTPEAVVERILAVQAQDPRGARLAIRSRSQGLSAADFDAALERRSLVIDWLNRGTLHLVRAEDWWWLHPLTTPQLANGLARRLRQEGVTEAQLERGVEEIAQAVAEAPQTRAALRARLDAAGVPTAGQAFIYVVFAASLRGLVVRGPMIGRDQAWVGVREWLGDPPPALEREEALARLAARYLAGHGPAEPADLARWAGISLRDARSGMAAAGPAPASADDPPPLPAPRLLGAFEPLLLGWVSREPVIGRHAGLVTSNGIFHPFALVDGRAVAKWRLVRDRIEIEPLEPLAADVLAALQRDGEDVRRYLSAR